MFNRINMLLAVVSVVAIVLAAVVWLYRDETGQDENSDRDNTDETASNDDGEKNSEVSGDTDSGGVNASEDTEGVADEGEGIDRPDATATPARIF